MPGDFIPAGPYVPEGGATGQVADAINDGTTTVAPSQNAVFDALALTAPLASPTFTGTVTVPDASFSLAKLANIATARFLGRRTASSGPVEEMTIAQVKTDLGVGSGSPVESGGVGSDHWFNPPGCAGGTLSTALLSANSVFYIPWFTPVDIVITAVAVRCTTLAASSLIRAGIASVDSSMQPLALVNEFSTFDTTSTGVKSYTGLSVAIPAGRYVTAVKAEGGNPTMAYSPIVAGPSAGFYATFSSGGGTAASFQKTTSAGAYTNPPPAWDSVSGSFSFLFMRWVSA